MPARPALIAALAALASIAVPGVAGAATSWNKGVRSYPGLRIPRIWVTAHDDGTAPGYIFLTPRAKPGQRTGPTILDAQGRVVWFHQLARTRTAIGLRPQTYRGKPVITWGQRPPLVNEGDLYTGSRHSVYNVIADTSYHVIARVRAGNGVATDLHEFDITKRNTALVLGFRNVNRNLRRYGGPERSAILDNVVQEVDIKTGKVLFSWSAARRLSPAGSYVKPPDTGAWDAYHVNAVSEDTDGNLLLTARHMSTVYKIDRHTGKVIWKLGGRDSDFKVSRSAAFYYPHDAQRASDGTLTIFDNRSTAVDKSRGRASRALRLKVNTKTHTASLAGAFRHPSGATVLSTSQGNATRLSNGNVFVGWGSSPWFSEHAADGRLLFAGHLQSAWNQSYRAFKAPWTATPDDDPRSLVIARKGQLSIFASWNGATAVARWQVLAGADAGSLQPIGSAPWQDFETKMVFAGTPAAVRVQALDAAGEVIGQTPVTTPTPG